MALQFLTGNPKQCVLTVCFRLFLLAKHLQFAYFLLFSLNNLLQSTGKKNPKLNVFP